MSAWTSTERDVDKIKKQKSVDGLLTFLASAKPPHTTPFEKSLIHFLVRVDTATHIHLLKHRIGVSINGESARYKELKQTTHHIPADWPPEWQEQLHNYVAQGERLYTEALAALEPTLGRKRAKESARYFFTYSNQLTLDVSFNWKSFVHFLSLRRHDDAQREIDDIATKMLELVRETGDFDLTIKAWGL